MATIFRSSRQALLVAKSGAFSPKVMYLLLEIIARILFLSVTLRCHDLSSCDFQTSFGKDETTQEVPLRFKNSVSTVSRNIAGNASMKENWFSVPQILCLNSKICTVKQCEVQDLGTVVESLIK